MTQTPEEKADAIKSVLPLLHEHLDLIDRVHTALERLSPDTGEAGYLPRDPGSDEPWVRLARDNAWRWRLGSVLAAWEQLLAAHPAWALAVYYRHIEPFPEWNPKRQFAMAEEGVWWMATDPEHGIRGELAYCQRTAVVPTVGRPRNRADRDVVIVQMARAGCSYADIVGRAECSRRDVRAVLLAHGFREKSAKVCEEV